MALQPTVLTPKHIHDLLLRHYGISATTAERLPLGTANCYHITDGEKSYFLKEFQSNFCEDDILREVGVVEHLAAMPYVYLFQLARSRYGYPQYLSGKSEDANALLQFATWRTDMCREIESRAQEISAALLCT